MTQPEPQAQALKLLEVLTWTQFQVLWLCGKGNQQGAMVQALRISRGAISVHGTRMRRKLGCTTMYEACALWGLAGQPSKLAAYGRAKPGKACLAPDANGALATTPEATAPAADNPG